jgi:hypothetical protein
MIDINTESDIHELQAGNGEQKKKPRGTPFKKGNKFGCGSKKSRVGLSLSKYIKKKTNEGKELTDFYTGILKAVKDSDPDNVPMYKGMKVTVELSSKAVDWLGKNGWGTPSQRTPEPEVDTRSIDEKLKEMEYILKELGYRMVPIDSPSPERSL